LVLVVILNATVFFINSVPLTEGNGTNPGDLNDGKIMEIGEELKLPMLQMIGKTIDNIEKEFVDKVCDLHPCSEWTDWFGCTARSGQFGSKFRTRQCRVNTTRCEIDSSTLTEKEFGICIGVCPIRYNITIHGLCLKLFADNKGKEDVAKQQCQKDGGHIVNIYSEMKLEDVTNLLTGFNPRIWIDGHRKDPSSPWEYTYGSNNGFFKWYKTEPQNKSNELCLMVGLNGNVVEWYGVPCTTLNYPIFEIE
jgi:hypothetical protein